MSGRAAIRYQGEVVEWSEQKRCGFIRPRGATESDPLVFVSKASMATRKKEPQVGDVLIYEVVKVPTNGKTRRLRTPYRAEYATFLGEEVPEVPNRRSEVAVVTLGIGYLALLGLAQLVLPLAPLVLAGDAAACAIAFVAYWLDKKSAENNRRRVPESTLHVWALVGGWPGAAIAQWLFRHKTRKGSYQTVFRLMVVLNIVLTGCILYVAKAH